MRIKNNQNNKKSKFSSAMMSTTQGVYVTLEFSIEWDNRIEAGYEAKIEDLGNFYYST